MSEQNTCLESLNWFCALPDFGGVHGLTRYSGKTG